MGERHCLLILGLFPPPLPWYRRWIPCSNFKITANTLHFLCCVSWVLCEVVCALFCVWTQVQKYYFGNSHLVCSLLYDLTWSGFIFDTFKILLGRKLSVGVWQDNPEILLKSPFILSKVLQAEYKVTLPLYKKE